MLWIAGTKQQPNLWGVGEDDTLKAHVLDPANSPSDFGSVLPSTKVVVECCFQDPTNFQNLPKTANRIFLNGPGGYHPTRKQSYLSNKTSQGIPIHPTKG
jgi:hypothetical protein